MRSGYRLAPLASRRQENPLRLSRRRQWFSSGFGHPLIELAAAVSVARRPDMVEVKQTVQYLQTPLGLAWLDPHHFTRASGLYLVGGEVPQLTQVV